MNTTITDDVTGGSDFLLYSTNKISINIPTMSLTNGSAMNTDGMTVACGLYKHSSLCFFICIIQSCSDFDRERHGYTLADLTNHIETFFFVFHHATATSTCDDFGRWTSDIEFYPCKCRVFFFNILCSIYQCIDISSIDLRVEWLFIVMMDKVFNHSRRACHIAIRIHKFCPQSKFVCRIVLIEYFFDDGTIREIGNTVHRCESKNH